MASGLKCLMGCCAGRWCPQDASHPHSLLEVGAGFACMHCTRFAKPPRVGSKQSVLLVWYGFVGGSLPLQHQHGDLNTHVSCRATTQAGHCWGHCPFVRWFYCRAYSISPVGSLLRTSGARAVEGSGCEPLVLRRSPTQSAAAAMLWHHARVRAVTVEVLC